MTDVALATGLATLACGILGALVLPRLPTLQLQIMALALAATLLPMAAVMIGMGGADPTMAAVTVAALGAALVGALLLGRIVMRSVDRLRRASVLMAAGDVTARAPEDGPAELAELGGAINAMAANLAHVSDSRRRLMAWASHDLRTPLANMQAMLEALEDGLGTQERYLPALREQVRVLGALVEDLFELARIDGGQLTLVLEDAEIDGLVYGCLRSLEAEAQVRRVRLQADLSGPLPPVRCAPDKVERVLLNLLRNALHHTPGEGAVAVRVQAALREMKITVEDTGVGIPPEALHDAFEPFWRGDPARAAAGGSGLGLAIARGLVQAHGGRVWAENRPEGGACVSFTLPLTASFTTP